MEAIGWLGRLDWRVKAGIAAAAGIVVIVLLIASCGGHSGGSDSAIFSKIEPLGTPLADWEKQWKRDPVNRLTTDDDQFDAPSFLQPDNVYGYLPVAADEDGAAVDTLILGVDDENNVMDVRISTSNPDINAILKRVDPGAKLIAESGGGADCHQTVWQTDSYANKIEIDHYASGFSSGNGGPYSEYFVLDDPLQGNC